MLVSPLQAGTRYDVAILGTGIGGTILGAILARHGQKVLLIEQGVHPRFTIGESTIPETTILFRILAARYGVPEIGNLATYQRLNRYGSGQGAFTNTDSKARPFDPKLARDYFAEAGFTAAVTGRRSGRGSSAAVLRCLHDCGDER